MSDDLFLVIDCILSLLSRKTGDLLSSLKFLFHNQKFLLKTFLVS